MDPLALRWVPLLMDDQVGEKKRNNDVSGPRWVPLCMETRRKKRKKRIMTSYMGPSPSAEASRPGGRGCGARLGPSRIAWQPDSVSYQVTMPSRGNAVPPFPVLMSSQSADTKTNFSQSDTQKISAHVCKNKPTVVTTLQSFGEDEERRPGIILLTELPKWSAGPCTLEHEAMQKSQPRVGVQTKSRSRQPSLS
ncbi:hypothetical protein BHM03_00032455 [Ensete ventricosum]|nr:hypothetical protein BHM03_00032455 [Ensete ventricosum]